MHAVHAVDGIDEEDEDENKGDLDIGQRPCVRCTGRETVRTFMPYWNFAITGLVEMKLNIALRHVKGSGRINNMKMDISHIRRKNT